MWKVCQSECLCRDVVFDVVDFIHMESEQLMGGGGAVMFADTCAHSAVQIAVFFEGYIIAHLICDCN